MSEVVALPGRWSAGQPAQNVVELLEDVLADAKSGRVVTVGIVTVSTENYVGSSFATSGAPHAHSLVAGAVYLLRRCEKNAGVD